MCSSFSMTWFLASLLVALVLLLHLEDLEATALPKVHGSQLHNPAKLSPAKVAAPNGRGKSKKYQLSSTYYLTTCPDLEAIINRKLTAWIKRDYTLAPALIRLHFHDCAVRGCDGSILLNHPGSERRAYNSITLRGFEVIDDIKTQVERQCPKTVSCADILTIAARDATVLAGGPFWEVPLGRKDGPISSIREADSVPSGRENVTALMGFFAAQGLNVLDLVALSGAHTIGRSSCSSIQHRLASRNASMNVNYMNLLRRKCSAKMVNQHELMIDLDAATPRTFDAMYYTNLEKNMGLLSTDQSLYSDPRTAPFVAALASQSSLFESQFSLSMVNLGNVQVLTGPEQGEIRLNCNYVN